MQILLTLCLVGKYIFWANYHYYQLHFHSNHQEWLKQFSFFKLSTDFSDAPTIVIVDSKSHLSDCINRFSELNKRKICYIILALKQSIGFLICTNNPTASMRTPAVHS